MPPSKQNAAHTTEALADKKQNEGASQMSARKQPTNVQTARPLDPVPANNNLMPRDFPPPSPIPPSPALDSKDTCIAKEVGTLVDGSNNEAASTVSKLDPNINDNSDDNNDKMETARAKISDSQKESMQKERKAMVKDVAVRLRKNGDDPMKANLTAKEIKRIGLYLREKLMLEKGFLDLEPPMIVVGDIHGQFSDLIGMFEQNGEPPEENFLFLGDYVDRGPFQTETIVLLLTLKYLHPNQVHLLRGNHETRVINKTYGFYTELTARFGKEEPSLWELYQTVFCCLPLCARIGKRIFCMHGGIPQGLKHWKQLDCIRKPLEVPDHGIICDLLWADPDPDVADYQPSPRGVSQLFSEAACKEFCNNMNIDLIIRAHQVARDGYEFFANRKLVTIFSAPFYCEEFDNVASVVVIDKDLQCKFRLRQPCAIEQKVLQTLGEAGQNPTDEKFVADMDPPDMSKLPRVPALDYILSGKEKSDVESNVSIKELNKKK